MIPHKVRMKVIELRAQGMSIEKTAKTAGICKMSVQKICKQYPEQIASLKAVEIEATCDKVQELAEARAEGLLFIEKLLRENILKTIKHDENYDWRVKERGFVVSNNYEKQFKLYLKVLNEMNGGTTNALLGINPTTLLTNNAAPTVELLE